VGFLWHGRRRYRRAFSGRAGSARCAPDARPLLGLRAFVGAESKGKGAHEALAEARLKELLGFFETATAFYDQVRGVPKATLLKVMKLGRQLVGLLDRAVQRAPQGKERD
jgi:hypothetical protein